MSSETSQKAIRGSYRGYARTKKEEIVALVGGERSLRAVAKDFKIPEATLRGWKRKLENGEELLPGK